MLLAFAGISECWSCICDVILDTDGLSADFRWYIRFVGVDTYIYCIWVIKYHLPERIFDDTWRVIFYACFKKQIFLLRSRKALYSWTALHQPSSWTKVWSCVIWWMEQNDLASWWSPSEMNHRRYWHPSFVIWRKTDWSSERYMTRFHQEWSTY